MDSLPNETNHPLNKLPKYPRLTFFIIIIILAYLLFSEVSSSQVKSYALRLEWAGIIIAGAMYAYGFTSPFAAAIFLLIGKEYPILLASLIGGLGAMLADLLIFKLIRSEFMDEIEKLKEEKWVKSFIDWLSNIMHVKLKSYLLPIIGAAIIASPLPDELGVSIMASYNNLSQKTFLVLSYIMNTLGIMMLIYISRFI